MDISLRLHDARRRQLTPAQTIVLAFLAAIVIGTILLSLPVAHAPGQTVSILDALFTATSAVCVTGLVVVDTGGSFSRFGEITIMLLIKSGGLGILSLGALLALATGRRLGFKERLRLQLQSNHMQVGGVVRFIRNMLLLTTAVELLGALILFFPFSRDFGTAEGIFNALFHSVSAFNNAGFSLFADNLSRYAGNAYVSLTIAGLLIFGGIGLVVVLEVTRRLKGARFPLSLHTKVALSATLALIVIGTAFMLVGEWSNPATLGELTTQGKLTAGFFQAVTPRTAGFNSLDFASMHNGTLFFVILLMFIGGNPGSTAGGVKTTTFAVLVVAMWAEARGHGRPTLFKRRIDSALVAKAAVVTTLAILIIGGAVTALSFTEAHIGALPLLFEVVSAVGTVGLSLGITPDLTSAGKLILTAMMLLGRIGMVTFAVAVAGRRVDEHMRYPREELVIG
ncbi:MAG TPA: TrkH family potassium uptake protein [Trueperaceae bacterium]|nr:TrkH family potassium uptake protein [Trueperaceae bacterium]